MAEDKNNPVEKKFARIHVTVEGRVQGVGFRSFVQRNAINYELSGWVRNRWNGTVELIAEGKWENLIYFIKIIERGPFSGTTKKVVVDWNEPSEEFINFNIRMTG